MKAMVQNGYGDSKVLSVGEVDKPTIEDDEVLIRVHAVSVNSGDTFMMRGTPFMIRFVMGLRPKNHILGWDVAGTIEEVGKEVSALKPGDEVYTACEGAFAEYAKSKAAKIGKKPKSLSFAETAAMPTAGLTALQGLRDYGKVKDGQSVLVHGASGGVGHLSVQIAKAFDWNVTGVCSGKNATMVRSLGADRVIDYTEEDFTTGDERYDLIFDLAATKSFRRMKKVLTPEGFISPNSGHGGMSYVIRGWIGGLFSRKIGKMYVADSNTKDLDVLARMVDEGKLKPVIDRTYTFEELPEALDYVATAHARGKVVATLV